MDHVRWSTKPNLRDPIVVAAFEGWNDAGDAASTAIRFLRDRWDATSIASIDPEEFFDFSTTRPLVQLDGEEREIVWPPNRVYAATIPDRERDVVLIIGNEPQLRWRTFCDQVMGIVTELGGSMLITVGALISDVAHSRPVELYGVGYDTDLVAKLQLEQSNYEGPTGIVGVLHAACRDAGVPSASLWAAVPGYVPAAPSPKAALALVERIGELLDIAIVTTDLQIASASYERQVSELVAEDDDTAAYVRQLEARYDELDKSDDLVEEVERFLRERRTD